MRVLRRPVVAVPLGIVALGGIIFAWWLVSPLLLNESVDEEFPLTANATIPDGTTRADAEETMREAAEDTHEMDEAMPSGIAEPTVVSRGAFRDADGFHRGEGTATVYELEDGSRVLRLEDFKVTNGPELHVILTAHDSPANRSDVHTEPYLDIGKLKGNIGNQNYPLPDDIDVTAYGAVVIYCSPFHVVFSIATLD